LQRQPATAIRDSRKTAKKVKSLTASALQALMKYHWPGNVRELENLIERLVVLNQKDELDVADLPPEYRELRRLTSTVDDDADIKNYQDALREKRIEIIRNALVHTTGNQAAAARLLKIQPSYLCKMIKDLGMRE
jgi:DNA-binding NtrC family response regulator